MAPGNFKMASVVSEDFNMAPYGFKMASDESEMAATSELSLNVRTLPPDVTLNQFSF